MGITGIGVDVFSNSINSNNLGDHNRSLSTLFLEHRFLFFKKQLSITPGIAFNSYSDFGNFSYPGLDLGWTFSPKAILYANAGYTYRIPTYTDLFYSDFTTQGNNNLKPEKALTGEVGFRYGTDKVKYYLAYFNRKASDLIDYIKFREESKWEAKNIQEQTTNGIEAEFQWQFILEEQPQKLIMGYTFLNDNLNAGLVPYSRYSINSFKHHFTATYQAQFSDQWYFFTAIKFGERSIQEGYTVIDFNLVWKQKKWELNLMLNNLLDTRYTETNLVPMPGLNALVGIQFRF